MMNISKSCFSFFNISPCFIIFLRRFLKLIDDISLINLAIVCLYVYIKKIYKHMLFLLFIMESENQDLNLNKLCSVTQINPPFTDLENENLINKLGFNIIFKRVTKNTKYRVYQKYIDLIKNCVATLKKYMNDEYIKDLLNKKKPDIIRLLCNGNSYR